MSGIVDVGRNAPRSVLTRAADLLGFWLILSEFSALDLLVIALAALRAASVSVHLLRLQATRLALSGSQFGPESTSRGARSILVRRWRRSTHIRVVSPREGCRLPIDLRDGYNLHGRLDVPVAAWEVQDRSGWPNG